MGEDDEKPPTPPAAEPTPQDAAPADAPTDASPQGAEDSRPKSAGDIDMEAGSPTAGSEKKSPEAAEYKSPNSPNKSPKSSPRSPGSSKKDGASDYSPFNLLKNRRSSDSAIEALRAATDPKPPGTKLGMLARFARRASSMRSWTTGSRPSIDLGDVRRLQSPKGSGDERTIEDGPTYKYEDGVDELAYTARDEYQYPHQAVTFERMDGFDFGKNAKWVSPTEIAYINGSHVGILDIESDEQRLLHGKCSGGVGAIEISHDGNYLAVAECSRIRNGSGEGEEVLAVGEVLLDWRWKQNRWGDFRNRFFTCMRNRRQAPHSRGSTS